MEKNVIKGIVIAGTNSGAGKTTISLGLMAALRRRGLTVAPYKVGPDFIDPGHHTQVTGRASRNLDGWMLSRAYNQACFHQHAMDADMAVVEGVMGLYDGFSGSSEAGSTAQMAKWLGLPVLLVVNAASMARSAAALVQGFTRFDPDISFSGVVFNNLGSPGHLEYLRSAMQAYVDIPLIGGIVRDDRLRMPERHLGLITAQDQPVTEDYMALLADRVEDALDLDLLLDRLPTLTKLDSVPHTGACVASARTVKLGVARDRAFCFYYPDNLDLLSAAGAQVVPFSPSADKTLPEGLDGIYLGGGYPELHADRLSANESMRDAIAKASRAGMPIYAECGGLMYLCRELKDRDGNVYPMCGCFPYRSEMQAKLRILGYREVFLKEDTLLGSKGSVIRGHEFHYSEITTGPEENNIEQVYMANARKGSSVESPGYRVDSTLGSYVHLHFGSHPECAVRFVKACREYRDGLK